MGLRSKLQKISRYFLNAELYKNLPTSIFRLSNLSDPPIIVCGAPRSGTTLLISVIDAHPDILAIPYETWLLVNKRKKRWFPWESWNRRFMFLQLYAMMVALPIRKTHKRWAEKTPDNVMHLDYIFSLFGDRVKVIHIIRDGRDVVLSQHKQLGQFMTPQKWVKYVEAGLLYKDDPRVLTIRYEDLITQFNPVIKQVCTFLAIPEVIQEDFYKNTNINDNPSIISGYGYKDIYAAKPLSTDSINKWKKNEEVQRAFREYPEALALLKKLNYEV